MQKVRNLILVGCTTMFLGATLACQVAVSLGANVPAQLAPNQEGYNYLEGRNYTELPALSVANFTDGSFQDNLESHLADAVPLRSNVLLANAALQRTSIAEMAGLMGYEVYPTFFGSDFVYSTASDAVYQAPLTQDRCNVRAMEKSLSSYNKFAESHPELRCFFAMPTRSNALSFEPFTSLVSSPVTNQFYDGVVAGTLGSSITPVDITVKSFDDFDRTYFRTDHHWTIDGAYNAYCTLATALGYGDELVVPDEALLYENAQFNGSNARQGLEAAQEADAFMDYEFDLPAFTLTVDGEPTDTAHLANFRRYTTGNYSTVPFFNYYSNYFHSDHGLMTIQVEEERGRGSLLIVGDSYTNPIERLFTAHYDTVYVYDPRHATESLSEFVAHTEVGDVVVCLCYQTLCSGKPVENLA